MSFLRPKSLRCALLESAHGAGPEPGHSQSLDNMSLPQAVLPALSAYQYRGSGAVRPVFTGHNAPGALHISVMSVYDRHRGGQASWPGLENGQKHRQVLFRGSIRSTLFRWAAYFSRGRNLCQKGSPLPHRGTGLSQWPGNFCWQRPKGQNFKTFFQPNDRRPA